MHLSRSSYLLITSAQPNDSSQLALGYSLLESEMPIACISSSAYEKQAVVFRRKVCCISYPAGKRPLHDAHATSVTPALISAVPNCSVLLFLMRMDIAWMLLGLGYESSWNFRRTLRKFSWKTASGLCTPMNYCPLEMRLALQIWAAILWEISSLDCQVTAKDFVDCKIPVQNWYVLKEFACLQIHIQNPFSLLPTKNTASNHWQAHGQSSQSVKTFVACRAPHQKDLCIKIVPPDRANLI